MEKNNNYEYKKVNYFLSGILAIVGLIAASSVAGLSVLVLIKKIHIISIVLIIIITLFAVVLFVYSYKYFCVFYITKTGIQLKRFRKTINKIDWKDMGSALKFNTPIGTQYGTAGYINFIIISTDKFIENPKNLSKMRKSKNNIVMIMDKEIVALIEKYTKVFIDDNEPMLL